MRHEELSSLDSWVRAAQESQHRSTERRARVRHHRRFASLAAFFAIILCTGVALLLIGLHVV